MPLVNPTTEGNTFLHNPIDIAGAVPFALQDYDAEGRLPGGAFHPVLTLLQHWVDVADPLNFAAALTHGIDGEGGKHVFQTYGLDDSYSPPSTMRAYAVAARLTEVEPDDSVSTPDELSKAQSDNREPPPYAGAELTQAVRQYENDSGDGHFVIFDVASANRDVRDFLGMAALGLVPQVGR